MYCKSPNPLTIIYESGILATKISDHMASFVALNFNKNKNYKHLYTICTRPFTGNKINCFLGELEKINWPQIFDHDTTADPLITYYQQFSTKLDEVINTHFPLKVVKFNKHKHKKCKWMTHTILTEIKKRDALYRYLNSTKPETYKYTVKEAELNITVTEVRKLKRETKAEYYNLEFNKSKNDIKKKTWETIADVMSKSKIQNKFPAHFNINEKQITDKKEIADKLNSFFINIGPKLANELDPVGKPDFTSYLNINKLKTVFKFTPIEEEETKNIITNLKPKYSSRHDIMTSINSIGKPLTCIINQSLKTGRFPSKLKVAHIIPIFKKGDEHDFNNYRPISLLPSISKVFEKKPIYSQLFQYLSVNALLHANQYGFRAKYSTELGLNELVDRIYSQLDEKKYLLPYVWTCQKHLTRLTMKSLSLKWNIME